MKPKEDRKRWSGFADEVYPLLDDDGYFIDSDRDIWGYSKRKKRADKHSEEAQIDELKRKRFRTPHEL